LHRVDGRPQQAPPLPIFESDDKEITGDEPEYVLHDSDDEKEKKSSNKTFESILNKESHTAEPKKAYMRRWNSLSKAATKFIPKLPPLPGDSRAAQFSGEGQGHGASGEKPLPTLPRRRASTMSAITRGVADGVKQMFAEDSEYRAHRAR
jgi:hypothetical protein